MRDMRKTKKCRLETLKVEGEIQSYGKTKAEAKSSVGSFSCWENERDASRHPRQFEKNQSLH